MPGTDTDPEQKQRRFSCTLAGYKTGTGGGGDV
jgi:hypothetical protein